MSSQSHIVSHSDAVRTLCGVKVNTRPKTAGITTAEWVQAHIDGHNPQWCEQCLFRWSQR